MIAWFLCPYKRDPEIPRARYCAFEDYFSQLKAEGASWGTVEIDGNRALVKVNASNRLLNTIANDGACTRLTDDTIEKLRQRLGSALIQRRKVRCEQDGRTMTILSDTVPLREQDLLTVDTRIR